MLFKQMVSSRWTGLICVLIAYLGLLTRSGEAVSSLLWITNLGVVIYSCFFIYSDKNKPISIKKICGIFFLLFFGLAPIMEYRMKIKYWGGAEIHEYDYIVVNFLILISMVLFDVVYKISFLINRLNARVIDDRLLGIAAKNKMRFSRLLLPVIGSMILIIWFNDYNFYNLLFRGGDLRGDVVVDSKALGLIVNNFLRPFCFSVLILCVFVSRQYSKINFRWTAVFFPIALLTCFPTGMARFAIAALYIPLILVFFPIIFKSRFLAVNFLVISFVTFFPLFDAFRTVGQDFSLDKFSFNFDFFTAGHFDAYQNFTRVVSLDIVTGGSQLLGAILFFVPRAMWSTKPVGSGELLAEKANLWFSNLSQSFFAEGYINFGIFGIFIFVIFLAYGAALLDRRFWDFNFQGVSSTFSLYFFQIIGLSIFILRGDMLNAVAYTAGFLTSMAVACGIYKSKPIGFGFG